MKILAVAATTTILAATCSCSVDANQPQGPVQEPEAIALLNQVVQAANSENYAELCENLSGSSKMCQKLLADAKRQCLQPGPIPTWSVSEPVSHDNDIKGWHLELHGKTGNGIQYVTDFMVIRDINGDVRTTTPVYWSGIRLAKSNTLAPTGAPAPYGCASFAGGGTRPSSDAP
ncbi:hypothetical protein [Nonomuraea sp. NPDC050691]|uniref:hypothetical protein n=1 Tax=Nonomuraea sp. NPDC050691 TaxID=3155661 RepID=UPI0033DA59D1